jgi:ankyrin repeat protein
MMNPLVLTERPKLAVEEFPDFWSFRANTRMGSVGCGQFTCEADRPVCAEILRGMLEAKLEHLAEVKQRVMTTLFGVAEAKLCATSMAVPLTVQDDSGADATWEYIQSTWKLGHLNSEEQHPIGAPIVAAMLGDLRLLREVFVEGGADITARHKATGATTIMYAAGAGDVSSVEFLLENARTLGEDALIDVASTKLKISPIDRAIRCGHTEIVRLLLRWGASVTITRSSGCTPLHAAAEMGRVECAELLVEANADVNAVNNDGDTPLHMCASSFTLFGSQAGKLEVASLLVSCGALRDLQDNNGMTAHDVAFYDGNREFASRLAE